MVIKTELVTPEMAKKWLESSNPHNRRIYPSTVACYARDMMSGLWEFNNQGIGFGKDGTLLDGQHRLSAVIAANMPVRFPVFYGLNKSAQATVDGGKPRGAGDKLQLTYSISNGNLRAAIARSMTTLVYTKGGAGRYSVGTIKKIIDLYEDEINTVIANRKLVPGLVFSPVMAAMVFAAKCHPFDVVEFESLYFSGENLDKMSPILTFRNFMLFYSKNRSGSAFRLISARAFFTCFHHFINDTKIKLIRDTPTFQELFLSKQQGYVNELLAIIR